MTLRQFLMILRGRRRVLVLVFMATVAAVAAASALLPKRYEASATVVVDLRSPEPISGAMLQVLMLPGYLETQRDLIMSDRVLQKAMQRLKLEADTDAERRAGAKKLKKGLDVKVSRRSNNSASNVIELAYTADDPGLAAAAANAFAQAYIDASIELRVDPARQHAHWFDEQDKALRDDLERAEARLSDHQQKHGLGVTEERVDSEVTRLNDLTTQLAIAQAQAAEAKSRQLASARADTMPEVAQSPLIISLKREIALQDARLKQLGEDFGPNHPEYRRTAAEIESLRSRLGAETRFILSSLRAARAVNIDKEAGLAAAVAAQKKRVLAMRQAREQLATLQRDRDIAQKAYENVTQRLAQTRLESEFRQANATILAPASEPLEPTFPNPLLNAVAAIFLGTFLALGAAFALEFADRRVHTTDDLVGMVQLPVLGVVPGARLPAPVQPRRLAPAPASR